MQSRYFPETVKGNDITQDKNSQENIQNPGMGTDLVPFEKEYPEQGHGVGKQIGQVVKGSTETGLQLKKRAMFPSRMSLTRLAHRKTTNQNSRPVRARYMISGKAARRYKLMALGTFSMFSPRK